MDKIRSKFFKRDRSGARETSATSSTTASSSNGNNKTQPSVGLGIEYFQTQLILDCLVRIPYSKSDHDELIVMCAEQIDENSTDLRTLREFQDSYAPDRALWWYIRECFLYKILNYSLESVDIRNLYLFRRIIHDIQEQMERSRSRSPIHVYRSQLMSSTLLNRWVTLTGQCVAVDSFLSATKDRETAITFLNSHQSTDKNSQPVLLEIDADPRVVGSKPFVQLESLNYATDKNEVLFMFGSVFMINNINCGPDGIYVIEMTLYNTDDHEFQSVFDDLKHKYHREPMNLLTFSRVLLDFDRFSEAEEYTTQYLSLLTNDHPDKLQCYRLLGSIALAQHDSDASLRWFRQVLDLQMQKSSSAVDPSLADDHENLANAYAKKESFDQAIKHYSAALDIKIARLSPQHPSVAASWEQLARVYEQNRDYSRAISCLEKALTIYRRTLPPNDEKIINIEKHIEHIA